MNVQMEPQSLTLPAGTQDDWIHSACRHLCEMQQGLNWWIGDMARQLQQQHPDTWEHYFPVGFSPDHVARCKAVAEAYEPADRNPHASWTIHMRAAKQANRLQIVAEHAENGRTSDEAREADSAKQKQRSRQWMLAIDVNYWIHRWYHSGGDMETAKTLSDWIRRLCDRLKEKGLTHVACCFDGPDNHRKELTKDWENAYKPRPPKEPELVRQLDLIRGLLEQKGLGITSIDGMEADDLMASYAAQFDGRVTLVTQDKDLRQCLADNVNMLLDVDWEQDQTSGAMVPAYQWLDAKTHTQETGIAPSQWADLQMIQGDNVDGIKGVPGIGKKGATDLIARFGSYAAVLKAAKADAPEITAKKRQAILQFDEAAAAITRRLVTMRTDLAITEPTRLT